MIITEKFVMINLPKTGSRFVRTVIKKLHEPYFRKYYPHYWLPNKKVKELWLPNIIIRDDRLIRKRKGGEHGVYSQIPQEYRNRNICSVIRNPFTRLFSHYFYADWKGNLPLPDVELRAIYPSFPDLSFHDFLDMHYRHGFKPFTFGLNSNFIYGPQTAQFIAFFATDPVKTFCSIDGAYSIKENIDQFAPIDFLHQENLNEELFNYLLKFGYSKRKIEFIREFGKLNQSTKPEKIELSQETRQLIYEKEKPLFELFPEYNSFL